MNGYNSTERVRWALARAREESARLRHEYVGTEHILLGLLGDEESLATHVVESFGVNPQALADQIDSVVKKGRASETRGPDLPYTSRAKKVIELAMTEAREMHHEYVGTEHVLLGLLREEKGIAAQLLTESGVTLDAARERILEILGTAQPERNVTRIRGVPKAPTTSSASAHMAASIVELLAQDDDVGAVFAAQGIDVATLVAALRALAKPSQAGDRASTEALPPEPPADAPPAA